MASRDFELPKFLLGTILMCLGSILHVTGLSSSFWCTSSDGTTYIGLWKICFTEKDTTVICFAFHERDNIPITPFICSALAVICAIFEVIASVTSALALCQQKKKLLRWTRKSGMIALIGDVLAVIAVCLYGGTYSTVTYGSIPNWSSKKTLSLAWSFYVMAAGTVTVLFGATLSTAYALKSSPVMTSPRPQMPPRVPSLLVHPPPYVNREPSPFRHVIRPRENSPLPFSRAAFQTPRSVSNSPQYT